MTIRIDALNPTVIPGRSHEIPAMREGISNKLRVEQILSLLQTSDIPDGAVTLAKLAMDARKSANYSFDDTTAQLGATDVQAAIDALASGIEGLDDIFLKPFVSSAFVAASGTAVEFTGIPDAQEIVLSLKGFKSNGTSRPLIQLGTSSGFVTTGYEATSGLLFGTTPTTFESVNGFPINSNSAAHVLNGVIRLIRVQGNTWAVQGNVASRTTTSQAISVNGLITLAAAADRIRVTTVNGSDTFDAGEINMSYQ